MQIEKRQLCLKASSVVGALTCKQTKTQNNEAVEQQDCSTRRSVRLLDKNMERLSLGEKGRMESITIHISFDDMPNCSGPVKKDAELETASKKTNEPERKLNEDLDIEVDEREKNEMKSETREMVLDDPLKSSEENLVRDKSGDHTEIEAPHANLDVTCFSEDEEANEACQDDAFVKISAEEIDFLCQLK